MKAGYGKRKGGCFEREVCKKLSLWISDGKNESVFWRSAMSGGRATLQFKKGINNKSQVCDISAIDPLGEKLLKNYIIECKAYKKLNLENLFYKTSQEGMLLFWKETQQKATETGKSPLLIARQNNKKDIICFPSWLGEEIIYRCDTNEICFFDSLNAAVMYLSNFLKPKILEIILDE